MLRTPLLAICFAGWVAGRGEAADPATDPSLTAPAVAAALVAATSWQHTETLRTSLGWRDNVLLSPFVPLKRGFGRAEVEGFALWSRSDWQFVSLLNGDVLRYFSPPRETKGEQTWFGHGELRWRHWPGWNVALKADGFFQDAVIDLSETESIRTIAPTRVQGAFATLTTRFALPGSFALEPLVQIKRTDYRNFAGDYDETRFGARLEWNRNEHLGISASFYEPRRDYADRQQFTVGGRARLGTHLQFWQRVAEAKLTTAWTAGALWNATLTTGRLENRDRSSGFFDYNQKRARAEVGWQHKKWKVTLDGEAKRLEYVLQTVGAGVAPPPRIADSFETSAQIDRELTAVWTVFVQYRWERNRSNESGFSYRANAGLAGIQRSF